MTNAINPISPLLDKVTEALIVELQTKGAAHTLQWIDGWYKKAAMAEMRDSLELGNAVAPMDTAIFLTKRVLLEACQTGLSSMQGTNAYRRAVLAACAELIQQQSQLATLLQTESDRLQAMKKASDQA